MPAVVGLGSGRDESLQVRVWVQAQGPAVALETRETSPCRCGWRSGRGMTCAEPAQRVSVRLFKWRSHPPFPPGACKCGVVIPHVHISSPGQYAAGRHGSIGHGDGTLPDSDTAVLTGPPALHAFPQGDAPAVRAHHRAVEHLREHKRQELWRQLACRQRVQLQQLARPAVAGAWVHGRMSARRAWAQRHRGTWRHGQVGE
eukprot:356690-Chlamydomonas_euryale.AAC.7